MEELHKLIETTWREAKIPQVWKTSIIVHIYENGDKPTCKNYRGIFLLCNTYKIYIILNKRFLPLTENITSEYQTEFRPSKSTTDQLFNDIEILRRSWEHNINVHQIFGDFRQAYDSIERNKLMNEFGIPGAINLVKATMTMNQLTHQLKVSRGLKQGDGMASTLFDISLEYDIRKTAINPSNILSYRSPQIAAYADDTNKMERTLAAMTEIYGLTINVDKRKVLSQTKSTRASKQ